MTLNLNLASRLAESLNLPSRSVDAALTLLEAGNTVPFIARYRKEATGELDEEQLRQIEGQAAQLRALEERRQTVLATIESQGKLSPRLKAQIEAANSRTALEDLYLPYKPKRRTRASIAGKGVWRALQSLSSPSRPGRLPCKDSPNLTSLWMFRPSRTPGQVRRISWQRSSAITPRSVVRYGRKRSAGPV